LDVSGPQNGIEYDLSEIVVSPAVMIVSPCEPEASASIGTFIGPGHVLLFAGCHGSAHGGVSTASAIVAT
jgi:hypothetical protein